MKSNFEQVFYPLSPALASTKPSPCSLLAGVGLGLTGLHSAAEVSARQLTQANPTVTQARSRSQRSQCNTSQIPL